MNGAVRHVALPLCAYAQRLYLPFAIAYVGKYTMQVNTHANAKGVSEIDKRYDQIQQLTGVMLGQPSMWNLAQRVQVNVSLLGQEDDLETVFLRSKGKSLASSKRLSREVTVN